MDLDEFQNNRSECVRLSGTQLVVALDSTYSVLSPLRIRVASPVLNIYWLPHGMMWHTQTTTIAVIGTYISFIFLRLNQAPLKTSSAKNNGKNIPLFVTFSRSDCLLAASSSVANFQSGCCYRYSVYDDLISAPILLLSVVVYSSAPLSANQTAFALFDQPITARC